MYQASQAFRNALAAPVRDVTMRVTSLSNYLTDSAGNISSYFQPTGYDIDSPTVEGVVYVDSTRATRRTLQIRVVNKDGIYTPKGSDIATYGTNAVFWWDKLIKVEYGLKVGSAYEWVPLGIFMVDRVDSLAEKGIGVLNIDGSDLWKRLTFSTFTCPAYWLSGATKETIIRQIVGGGTFGAASLSGAGIYQIAIESGIAAETTTGLVHFEVGDNRGEALKSLCEGWNAEAFVDVTGTLIVRPKTTTRTDWTFTSGSEATFLNITKSKTGDELFNHVLVTYETDRVLARGEAIDGYGTSVLTGTSQKFYTNSWTGTNVEAIGDRVRHIKSTVEKTTAACLERAKQELLKSLTVEEEISLPSVVNPLFEAGDIIGIRETAVTATNDTYELVSFDVPMRNSTQEIRVKKTRTL